MSSVIEVCESALNAVEKIIEDNDVIQSAHDAATLKYNEETEFKYKGSIRTSLPSNINYNDYENYIPLTKEAARKLKQRLSSAMAKDMYHYGDGKAIDRTQCSNNSSLYSSGCQNWAESKGYVKNNYRARGNRFEKTDCWGSCQCMKCGRTPDFHDNVQDVLQNVYKVSFSTSNYQFILAFPYRNISETS